MNPLYFDRGNLEKVEFLKQLPLFSGLSKQELSFLADQMRLVEYKRGISSTKKGTRPTVSTWSSRGGSRSLTSRQEGKRSIPICTRGIISESCRF